MKAALLGVGQPGPLLHDTALEPSLLCGGGVALLGQPAGSLQARSNFRSDWEALRGHQAGGLQAQPLQIGLGGLDSPVQTYLHTDQGASTPRDPNPRGLRRAGGHEGTGQPRRPQHVPRDSGHTNLDSNNAQD